jgi:hypothetical protein
MQLVYLLSRADVC